MDTLQKRVKAQLTADRRRLQREQMRLARRRVELGGQTAKILITAQKMVDGLVDDASTADTDKGMTAVRGLGRRVRELSEINARSHAVSRELAKLERVSELRRRLRLARALGGGDEPMIGREAAKAVLVREGKPLRIEEITREALEAGVVRLPGATPVQSMSSYLARAAKKGDTFVRIGPGTYDLKGRSRSVA